MEIAHHLADTLRQLRRERGWSLDRTAAATGVSKAMLGQIERGESSPTVATLWKIATGFNTAFSGLITPPPTPMDAPLFVTLDQDRAALPANGLQVRPMFPFDSRFGFELMELTLPPGTERLSESHEPGVVEHVTVISGTMELLLDERWHPLAAGEASRFAADRPHGYRNTTDTPAVFHNLIHYPAGTR
ncbi:helix-turn-helix domain-containing protein [Marinobacter sp. JSM 1782161]|uniref:helix-turn-helix domain-containing protein n=1 Tax=Marinobacter sp. JSM 1782161 TaxID=2685906 RepID=UPI001402023C|nr:XRE family transcriptional regulator [Marinobacter sp. JSM 1782161]